MLPKAEAAMTILRCSGLVQGIRLLAHPVSSDASRLQAHQPCLHAACFTACSAHHCMQTVHMMCHHQRTPATFSDSGDLGKLPWLG